jgi:hypothetical protein
MIDLGKAEVFKGERFDLIEGGVRGYLSGAHLLEQGLQSIRVHATSLSLGALR